ncbi:MAG: methyltransferase [Methermicoccaceae archaeon]
MERMCDGWPAIRGEYVVGEPTSAVAVCTLASRLSPSAHAAVWGGCMTENLGVEKVVLNIISNSHVRYLLVCGVDTKGHLPGDALVSLHREGIEESGRIRGAKGAIPYLEHLMAGAVERFQRQVSVVDMRTTVDVSTIYKKVDELWRAPALDEPPMVLEDEEVEEKAGVDIEVSGADALIADGVLMDAVAGVIFCEGDTC